MFYARLFVVFAIVYLLSDLWPEGINLLLVLVLVGLVLANSGRFVWLSNWVSKFSS